MIFTKSNFVKVVKFSPPSRPPPAPPAGVGGRGEKDYLINQNIKL